MALKGNLRDFSTTQLLNLINLARKTGTLTIVPGAPAPGAPAHSDQMAQMSFRGGKLIYASLDESSNGNLAAVLQRAGKLSAEQARFIEQRAQGTSEKQLGHLLIQAAYVTQSDIIQSVRQNILDTVYKLFTWSDGLFRFDANQMPPGDRITIPIDLESVIMEGSRRLKEWERLQEELPDLDISLRFTDKPDARLRNINLTVQEWRVVSFINPRNTIRQIGKANNLSDFEIRRIVYGLLQAGLIEIVPQPKPAPPTPLPQAGKQRSLPEPKPMEPAVKGSVVRRLINRIRSL